MLDFRLGLYHRHLLAERDRRGLMTESGREQLHIICSKRLWRCVAEMRGCDPP
jgi:hypothetical protein